MTNYKQSVYNPLPHELTVQINCENAILLVTILLIVILTLLTSDRIKVMTQNVEATKTECLHFHFITFLPMQSTESLTYIV